MFNNFSASLLALCVSGLSGLSMAQSASGTDIFIADLRQENGVFRLSNHRNITNRDGYDNQPYFLPDGERLFYTSAIPKGDESQTDVILYDVSKKHAVNISHSPESEYSPTMMPNGESYSMIRVAADGKQKLWSYSFDATEKIELLKDVEPVGYHAWVDEQKVVLFVLGEPHRFELANIVSGKSTSYDKDIGASLFKIPGTELMSYTRNKNQNDEQNPIWELSQFDPETKQSQGLTFLPKGAYYYAWSADAKALAAKDGKLLQWTYSNGKDKSDWVEFADVSEHCPKGASRMAVNPQNTLLAYVCGR